MAYPDHYLLSFGGPLRTNEIWNMNIRFVAAAVLTSDDQQAFCTSAKTEIQTWGTSANSGWSLDSKLAFVKFNRILPDGTYQDPGVTHRIDFAPVSMGTASSTQANQVALVITWMTAVTRGPAHLGRVYMPTPAITVSSTTGRISAPALSTVANVAATFLNNVNNESAGLQPDIEAHVVSNVGAGSSQRITAVRIGDVPDTQRRRRNALPEVYAVSTTLVTDL